MFEGEKKEKYFVTTEHAQIARTPVQIFDLGSYFELCWKSQLSMRKSFTILLHALSYVASTVDSAVVVVVLLVALKHTTI